jgi:hypothetical protein
MSGEFEELSREGATIGYLWKAQASMRKAEANLLLRKYKEPNSAAFEDLTRQAIQDAQQAREAINSLLSSWGAE